MNRLIFFGDSICFGQFISPHKIWVNKFSEYLGNSYNIINTSISGNTTRMALDRMQYDVLSHTPNICYIQFGLNDCNIWQSDNNIPRVPLNSFYANILEMIERLHAIKCIKLYLATNHPSIKSKQHNILNKLYNTIIRDIAYNNNIHLIDHEYFWSEYEPNLLLLPDGIHLNELGHNLYFNTIKKQFDYDF